VPRQVLTLDISYSIQWIHMRRVKQHSFGNVRMRRGQVHDTVSGWTRKAKYICETNLFNLMGVVRKSLKQFAITEEKVRYSSCEDFECGLDIAQAVNNVAGRNCPSKFYSLFLCWHKHTKPITLGLRPFTISVGQPNIMTEISGSFLQSRQSISRTGNSHFFSNPPPPK